MNIKYAFALTHYSHRVKGTTYLSKQLKTNPSFVSCKINHVIKFMKYKRQFKKSYDPIDIIGLLKEGSGYLRIFAVSTHYPGPSIKEVRFNIMPKFIILNPTFAINNFFME